MSTSRSAEGGIRSPAPSCRVISMAATRWPFCRTRYPAPRPPPAISNNARAASAGLRLRATWGGRRLPGAVGRCPLSCAGGAPRVSVPRSPGMVPVSLYPAAGDAGLLCPAPSIDRLDFPYGHRRAAGLYRGRPRRRGERAAFPGAVRPPHRPPRGDGDRVRAAGGRGEEGHPARRGGGGVAGVLAPGGAAVVVEARRAGADG